MVENDPERMPASVEEHLKNDQIPFRGGQRLEGELGGIATGSLAAPYRVRCSILVADDQ